MTKTKWTPEKERALRAAIVFCNYLGGCKLRWIDGRSGPHWEIRSYRLRPLVNACAALSKRRRKQ